MKLESNQQGINHIKRHLADAPELGSKFNVRITDAEKLVNILADYFEDKINSVKLIWVHDDVTGINHTELSFTIDDELKNLLGLPSDEFLGHHGIVEITDSMKSQIISEPRGVVDDDKNNVNVIVGIKPEPTNQLILHLRKYPNENGIFIWSAYPGVPSPGFPDRNKQSEEEYKESKRFWDSHAFIKN